MKKLVALAVLPLLLSACGIPTAVVLTSAVDGVSYVASGKTLTAHALSAATDKDCSVLFGITRGEFCKDKEKSDEFEKRNAGFVVPKDEPTVGNVVAPPAAESKSTEVQAALEPRFFDFDYETPPTPVANAEPASPVTSASAANNPQWTLVLGSFADHRSAVDLARRVKPEPGLVTAIVVEGAVHYRVSTRPLKRDQAVGRQLNIAALNLETVKLMPVCAASVQDDNCIALDRALDLQQATLP